jgi:hypothetical protein
MDSPKPSEDWAALHYRVERDSTGVKTSRRKLRRIAEQAAELGYAVPEGSHDVVRILDREGRIVMERDWGGNRQAAVQEEARIVEDLLHLTVVVFRARYGIVPGEAFEGDDEPTESAGDAPEAEASSDIPGAGPEGKPEGTSG